MNHKAKTLVILSPGFPESEADDTCLPERQAFVKSLKEQFPSLKIIVLAFQYPFIRKKYCWNGVEVISFGGRNKARINRLVVWYKVWVTLKSLNKQYLVIGLLNFWLGECAFVGKYFAKWYNVKQYCWLLGQDAKCNNKYFKLVNPNADNLIALSDFLSEEFCHNYQISPAHIIPCAVDPLHFGQQSFERNIDVLGAGSLIQLKQYDLFIKVIKSLTLIIPNLKAAICGKGPEMYKLQKLINDLQLEQHISLMNEIPHSEVLKWMQQSKVFLHTSSYEGFGVVCLEALYAGAQVVSFCSPMKAAIRNWHIVDNKDEMVNTILSILQSPVTYESVLPYSTKENAKAVMELFDYNEIATS